MSEIVVVAVVAGVFVVLGAVLGEVIARFTRKLEMNGRRKDELTVAVGTVTNGVIADPRARAACVLPWPADRPLALRSVEAFAAMPNRPDVADPLRYRPRRATGEPSCGEIGEGADLRSPPHSPAV